MVCGPERIEDNWWQEPVSRDYYIAADKGGQRYWVFRDRLTQQWYVHGAFV
jgi:protein ImuB